MRDFVRNGFIIQICSTLGLEVAHTLGGIGHQASGCKPGGETLLCPLPQLVAWNRGSEARGAGPTVPLAATRVDPRYRCAGFRSDFPPCAQTLRLPAPWWEARGACRVAKRWRALLR